MIPTPFNANRIVLKVGSALVAYEEQGRARTEWLAHFANDVEQLVTSGKQVILVTSGAIALGRAQLNLKNKNALQLEEKQAAAACGQIELFSAWRDAFATCGLKAAQLLLTAEDSTDRKRYLNARNTLDTLLELGAIPIINENDTVATSEIRFGDNDRLSARIAQMAGAELLVLFSDIDGLYTADPRQNASARYIEQISAITPEIEAMAKGSASAVGTGGMITKIAAAKIALSAGCHMLIASGNGDRPLKALIEGGRHTWFIASETPLSARKRWLSGVDSVNGSISVDSGAAAALRSGKSLLPAGVTGIEGIFRRGDVVLIRDPSGSIIGKGLIAYSETDARQIIGKQSQEIESILGYRSRDVLVHRDDMVIN